ncbi:hypothetical protein Tco_0098027 [Tanacetum coccineum]
MGVCPTKVLTVLLFYCGGNSLHTLDLVQDLRFGTSHNLFRSPITTSNTNVTNTVGAIRGTSNATTFLKILTMSTRSGPSPTTNTSDVRNTVGRGKEKSQENPNEPASDAALREFCDKDYNQLLPILAENMHQEKVQQEKLKQLRRLNFEEASQYSESGAPSRRGDVRKRLGPKDARSMSRSPEPRHTGTT